MNTWLHDICVGLGGLVTVELNGVYGVDGVTEGEGVTAENQIALN